MKHQATSRTSDAGALLDKLIGNDAEMRNMIAEEAANLHVARKIYTLRTGAKLTQAQLAKKVGTTQSVISQSAISRLEDADYDGHALAMLTRIAAVLERRVEIRFVPRPKFQST